MPPNHGLANWRLAAGLLAAAAYAVLSHWLMLHAAGEPWAVAALLGPLLLAALGVAVGGRHWRMLAVLVMAVVGLATVVAQGGVADVNRLYLMQHVGIHLALCASFGATLLGGRLSLIGRVAEHVHGTLSPAMAAYTRSVTRAWALYFAAMALLSLWVYATCAWSAWSLLANLLTPIAITALFVGEYLLRYRLHPEFERTTLSAAVRAYSRRAGGPES
ncbi:MAG: hypothetical protein H0W48_09325 [Methylibium sp.]|nr:hypothetical protein [Methylibium sp.]